MLCLLLAFLSCTKSPDKKSNKGKGVYEVCIDYGCSIPKKTSGCSDASAHVQYDPSVGTLLTLNGYFPDNTAIQFILEVSGNNYGGTFPLGTSGNTYNIASYFPVLGESEQYTTIDQGSGTLTITEYDQTNQRISGTFSFDGQYFNGNDFTNQFLRVSGTFSNVPIIDLASGEFPCD